VSQVRHSIGSKSGRTRVRPSPPGLDRNDPQEAARVLRELLPDPASRRFAAEVVASSIALADGAHPSSWCLSLFANKIRLNVGQVEVVTLRAGRLRLLVSTTKPIEGASPHVREAGEPFYPAVPVPSGVVVVTAEAMRVPADSLLAAHHEYVLEAAARKRTSPFRRAHSPGAVRFLEVFLGRRLPRPAYAVKDEVATGSAEEVLDAGGFIEGASRTVLVNAYERDADARRACIEHFGCRCAVCDLSFEERYGADHAGFIHVHHLVPLSAIRAEYRVDPTKDLRPVCPNCHAVIHSTTPPLSLDQVRQGIRTSGTGRSST
jgi:5-methylcytosine-specific restriction protein A